MAMSRRWRCFSASWPATSPSIPDGCRPLVVNDWSLSAHPTFLKQLEALTAQVDALKRKDPAGYAKKKATTRLAAIAKLAFEAIPQDPAAGMCRQGSTLGDENKHWFRAKLFQQ